MTNSFLFANNAVTTLASGINATATSITLATGTGALFPNPGANQQFAIDLNDAATGQVHEIIYCTARAGDVLTVIRAQEGTSGLSWLAGDYAANKITAGTLKIFTQAVATTFAVDTGTANAMSVAISLPVTSLSNLIGVPLQIQKSNAANSSGTVNLIVNTFTGTPVTHADGSALGFSPVPELPANAVFTVVLNSTATAFHLQSVTTQPATISEFTSSLTGSGWMKRPDGLIEQWGSGVTTSGTGSVVFPIAFPNAVLSNSAIVGTTGTTAQSPADHYSSCNPATATTTGMNIYSATGSSINMTYRVIGY